MPVHQLSNPVNDSMEWLSKMYAQHILQEKKRKTQEDEVAAAKLLEEWKTSGDPTALIAAKNNPKMSEHIDRAAMHAGVQAPWMAMAPPTDVQMPGGGVPLAGMPAMPETLTGPQTPPMPEQAATPPMMPPGGNMVQMPGQAPAPYPTNISDYHVRLMNDSVRGQVPPALSGMARNAGYLPPTPEQQRDEAYKIASQVDPALLSSWRAGQPDFGRGGVDLQLPSQETTQAIADKAMAAKKPKWTGGDLADRNRFHEMFYWLQPAEEEKAWQVYVASEGKEMPGKVADMSPEKLATFRKSVAEHRGPVKPEDYLKNAENYDPKELQFVTETGYWPPNFVPMKRSLFDTSEMKWARDLSITNMDANTRDQGHRPVDIGVLARQMRNNEDVDFTTLTESGVETKQEKSLLSQLRMMVDAKGAPKKGASKQAIQAMRDELSRIWEIDITSNPTLFQQILGTKLRNLDITQKKATRVGLTLGQQRALNQGAQLPGAPMPGVYTPWSPAGY